LGGDFTGRGLAEALHRRRIPIKPALLDQRLVAGVGNIYASESCFAARIDPRTPCRRVDGAGAARLRNAVRRVLRRALRTGATLPPPAAGFRQRARRRYEFLVYRREGLPCRRCGAPIERLRQGGRSTFWCPGCQG
ncbi:MAG: zinc finger domain-containing protein, partial [Planctomycetota bacterium]